ncbi:MAG TPA: hypothetical protein VLV86_18185, partial [Vicinamibacterales bacterium]|nr:hypothetical protein [Vicinamibacterales bacterium]
PSLTAFVVPTPTQAWFNTGAAVTIANGVATIPSATAGSIMLFYEYVPSFVNFNYQVTTGGGALQVWIAGKST